jgi:Raf kinase inhibitor-like YbhB/YbcL family protein
MKSRVLFVLCLSALLLGACAAPATEPTEAPPVDEAPAEPTKAPEPTSPPANTEIPPEPTEVSMPFELTSVIIAHEQPIPAQYSCDGEDKSPPLDWNDPSAGTQSFALIMDDPDAPGGTWDHWIVFNIPAEARHLPEAVSAGEIGATFGKNSWGRGDYGGPCPPSGTHRYFFKLYALDTTLSLDESAGKEQVLAAMEGHILAETELMGTFSR